VQSEAGTSKTKHDKKPSRDNALELYGSQDYRTGTIILRDEAKTSPIDLIADGHA